jgi:hypothetical protein
VEGEQDCLQEVRLLTGDDENVFACPTLSLHSERRYASLYFVACVGKEENELMTLEIIHHFVEILDRYFGNVSVMCTIASNLNISPK